MSQDQTEPTTDETPTQQMPTTPAETGLTAEPTPTLVPEAPEAVSRGLTFAIAAIIGGIILTAAIWKFGFVASISSYVMALGAVRLYAKGSGGMVKRGIPALIGLIVLGVVLAFFACVAVDLNTIYNEHASEISGTKAMFITDNIFNGELLGTYTKDALFFVGFAALGTFMTIGRLVTARKV